MTKLEKAANEFAGVNYDCEDEGDSFYHMIQKEAFIAGAKWAIDKACKWIKHYQEYPNHDISAEALIIGFRKYMES